MQVIHHVEKEYKPIHKFFSDLDVFYAYTSVKQSKKPSLISYRFPSVWDSLAQVFKKYADIDYRLNYTKVEYKKMKLPAYDPKNIIILASGGKDSVATILYYLERNYNIFLYHVKGMNQNHYPEYKVVQEIAEYLGLPIFVDNVQFKGTRDWVSSPLRDVMMISYAVQWGIEHDIGVRVATGSYNSVSLENVNFETEATASIEIHEAFTKIIRTAIPSFVLERPIVNYEQTFGELFSSPLLEMVYSCQGPNKYKRYWATKNLIRFGRDSLPNRCGSCWKCALEYIWYCDHNHPLFEYNERYYKHCIYRLYKDQRKYSKKPLGEISIWHIYFSYPMSKSTYYKDKDWNDLIPDGVEWSKYAWNDNL